jgi:hypothetical protein
MLFFTNMKSKRKDEKRVNETRRYGFLLDLNFCNIVVVAQDSTGFI